MLKKYVYYISFAETEVLTFLIHKTSVLFIKKYTLFAHRQIMQNLLIVVNC